MGQRWILQQTWNLSPRMVEQRRLCSLSMTSKRVSDDEPRLAGVLSENEKDQRLDEGVPRASDLAISAEN